MVCGTFCFCIWNTVFLLAVRSRKWSMGKISTHSPFLHCCNGNMNNLEWISFPAQVIWSSVLLTEVSQHHSHSQGIEPNKREKPQPRNEESLTGICWTAVMIQKQQERIKMNSIKNYSVKIWVRKSPSEWKFWPTITKRITIAKSNELNMVLNYWRMFYL